MRFARWEQQRAIEWSRKTYGESSPQCRALQQSSFTAGGAFIPENFVGQEFIERLTATAQVRKAGARSLPLVNGSATIPKLTGGATGTWIGQENDNAVPSQQTTGEVKLVEKKYMVLVPISNDLRRNSSLETERIVRRRHGHRRRPTTRIWRSCAAAASPVSRRASTTGSAAAAKTNQTGTTLANVRTDIRIMRNRLDGNNVPYNRRAWFMPSRSMNYIGWDLVDGNSNFAFPSMQNANGATLAGDPVYRDNNIPITLGSGRQDRDVLRRDVGVLHRRFDGARNRDDRERGLRGRGRHAALGCQPRRVGHPADPQGRLRHAAPGIGGDSRGGQPRRVVRRRPVRFLNNQRGEVTIALPHRRQI
jgi:HK97 family phage major capsid protein